MDLKSTYSHPNVLLCEHLLNTANNVSNLTFPSDNWKKVATLSAKLHDIGKASLYFQKHLHGEKVNKELTYHSLLSSIFALFIAEKINLSFEDIIIIVSCIRFHHSNLSDLKKIFRISERSIEILKKQFFSINKVYIEKLLNKLEINCNYEYLFNLFNNMNEKFFRKKYLKKLKKLIRYNKNEELFFKLNFIFSTLISSDKIEASGYSTYFTKNEKLLNCNSYVEKYKKIKIKDKYTDISKYREYLSKFLNERIKTINSENGLYSITLPTGAGKSLLSYNFAFSLLDKFSKNGIIYLLPFTSVIDQNYKVMEELLTENGLNLNSDILLKHHWISNSEYNINESDIDKLNQKLFVETWKSKIIISTFIQFFESLFGYKNRNLIKFNRFYNKIIILDEIQNIPVKYWKIVESGLNYLSKKFNCIILILTATKPLICSDSIELFDKTEILKNRTSLIINYEISDLELLVNLVIEYARNNKSVLVILNTINCAIDFFELVSTEFSDDEIEFLSSHITMYERKKRLLNIDSKKILISTQIVEAGMDIDFDIVIRDFAPLDSIIQSAGRCNRNSNNELGEVVLIKLKNKNGKYYSNLIYDNVLLNCTYEILKSKEYVESDFSKLIEQYFVLLSERKNIDLGLYDSILQMNYDENEEGISSFKLIDNDYKIEQIFLILSTESKKIWDKAIEIFTSDLDKLNKKKEFYKIKSKFYENVISVNKYSINIPFYNEILSMYYIPEERITDFYDIKTGKIGNNEMSLIF